MGEIIIAVLAKSIWGILAFLGGIGASALKGYYKDKKATALGLQAILRHDIKEFSKIATVEQNISYDDKEDLNDMYEAYKKLGGNSIITDIMKRVDKLPYK